MSYFEEIDVTFASGTQLDSFGRLRISSPETLFDSKNVYDDTSIATSAENQPLFYDNVETSGSGTSTLYNVNESSQSLIVSDNTNGIRVRQTKMRFNYQPGKSQLVKMSVFFGSTNNGITKREGLFDDNNGLFLKSDGSTFYFVQRSYVTGTPVDYEIPRSSWDDPMDGSGDSGIDLDLEKAILMWIDYEWLGVGPNRFGFYVGSRPILAHTITNYNKEKVYMSSPNLPLRSEIVNDGTGLSDSLTQICSSIISEGGTQDIGSLRYASTNGTHVSTTAENTIQAIIGIRLKQNYIGATIKQINMWMQLQTASEQVEWIFILNPTVSGNFTYVDEQQSSVQIARSSGISTVTGGYKLTGGSVESGGNVNGGTGASGLSLENAIKLGSTISGVVDEMVLCARPIGGSTVVNVEAGFTWREML